MSEVALLSNTDRPQQVEDYVRGCNTSTKYWPPSTSWRLCQRLYYFYQILTAFNRLKIMSEVVLLPKTDRPQQIEDYVRGCTNTKNWPTSTSWRLCQRLHYYQILTAFNKLRITVHGHKYSSPSIFYYIFHIKPYFFQKNILKLSLGRFLWNLFQDSQNSLNFICLSDSNFCLHGFCFLVI